MVHPYFVNTVNGLALICMGLISYFITPGQPATTLVIPVFGVLLLAFTYHLRRHNRFVFHTVTSLTLVAALLFFLRADISTGLWSAQTILLLLMGLSCFSATALYVTNFAKERQKAANANYTDDLQV